MVSGVRTTDSEESSSLNNRDRSLEKKLLGLPKLGSIVRLQIRIKESREFKSTIDKLVQRTSASLLLGKRFLSLHFL